MDVESFNHNLIRIGVEGLEGQFVLALPVNSKREYVFIVAFKFAHVDLGGPVPDFLIRREADADRGDILQAHLLLLYSVADLL